MLILHVDDCLHLSVSYYCECHTLLGHSRGMTSEGAWGHHALHKRPGWNPPIRCAGREEADEYGSTPSAFVQPTTTL